ncbi:MAG: HypC/HybG/HupF family hydrogenase formation chaperone [Candidatus Accumulibacter phosphatis]|uniref:HypC/HybG/HupF family hydrogenase formation chaperone n=1 Tax=Candidatus Accumulibacter phosphatis TaxID=327160 RepID=UPI001A4C47E4|nr:HypC/HybG/HupF family hydrogenase formation chaperone [Candidatus Accumulibacter phosphatis]
MCLSLPMQLVALEGAGGEGGEFALVERRQGSAVRRERINMMLIGPQPLGTWVLASLGMAREVVDDDALALIEDALAALSASLAGDYDPEQHFADLQAH